MPSADALNRFIAMVEANKHLEAIEEFYAPGASMQENELPPRVGKEALLAHEASVLANALSVASECVRPVFTNGDFVVIRWIFEFKALDGTTSRLEELAYQCWEGDRIVLEKFFYDPRQLKPRT